MGSLASPGSGPFLTAVSIRSALLTTTPKVNGLAYTVTVFNVIAAKFSTDNDTGGSRSYYCTVILYLLCMNASFLFSSLNNLVMPAISPFWPSGEKHLLKALYQHVPRLHTWPAQASPGQRDWKTLMKTSGSYWYVRLRSAY